MEKGKNRMLIESELRRDIYKTLNRENIGIPFPQQDVYLYSNLYYGCKSFSKFFTYSANAKRPLLVREQIVFGFFSTNSFFIII